MAPLSAMKSSVQLKDFKLSLLLDITKAINENVSREKLFEIFENVLIDKLKIGKIALFILEEEWICELKHGLENDEFNIDVEKDLLPVDRITYTNITPKKEFEAFDVVIPISHKSKALAYLMIGDMDVERIEISPTIKHRPFIQTLANIIIVAIENKKMAKEQIRQEGIKKELELASEMQSLLFPGELPKNDKLDIAAHYQPHHQIGGDYYDFIRLNDHEVVFCLADVSGKGIPAAFLMSNFQAYLRTLIKRIPLYYLVQRLNSKVMESAKGEKFITLFIAKYNMNTRVLNYINAGHNPPLLYSANSKEKERTSLLKIGCTGLGMFNDLPKVDEGIINIEENSTLLCYTDGVVELENSDKQEFGLEALTSLLKTNANLSSEELNEVIKQRLIDYKGSEPYIDDIALFCCKFY